MSGSGGGQRHGVRSRSSKGLQTFAMDKSIRSNSQSGEAQFQDFGASVSRPRSASSETAVLGNSFLSFS